MVGDTDQRIIIKFTDATLCVITHLWLVLRTYTHMMHKLLYFVSFSGLIFYDSARQLAFSVDYMNFEYVS